MKWKLALIILIAGCSFQDAETKSLVLYNWDDYMVPSVIEQFESETGIDVVIVGYDSNDQAVAEIVSNPESYDVIIASIPVFEQLKDMRLLTELDKAHMQNYEKVMEEFKLAQYDPGNLYSVPYLWGTTGYIVNTDHVSDAVDWSVFWNPELKGRIYLINDVRTGLVPVQVHADVQINTDDSDDLLKMEAAARELKENDVRFGETVSNLDYIESGEAWVAQVYNGDALDFATEHPEMRFVLPAEGFEYSVDLLMISSASRNRDEAQKLVDFLIRPEMNAENARVYYYASPIIGAKEMLPEEISGNEMVYPSQEILKNGEAVLDVGDAMAEYNRIFSLLK